jgi:DGQHR domain-containing protein
MNQTELRVHSLRIQQGPKRCIFMFAVDGKLLHRFAGVSRVRRGSAGDLAGYQRSEVLSHISEIRGYLESEDPMIPNALVVAFDDRVRFEPMPDTNISNTFVIPGTLIIPLASNGQADSPEEHPGWIVDGQQRAAAIRDAEVDSFPIAVSAFIASDTREQREQFILVNSTKPLPKGLLYELLPETETRLSSRLQKRRYPARLLHRLNSEPDSPFYRLIATPTTSEGIVKDNSVLRLIENSLSDGALYSIQRQASEEDEVEERHIALLKIFWAAVAGVFHHAWGVPPRKSRLMHGAGMVSMGFMMDAIAARLGTAKGLSTEIFAADLKPLREICCWTDGYWNFGPGVQRKWNEVQNTSKDIGLLSNFLLHQYKRLVWNMPPLET